MYLRLESGRDSAPTFTDLDLDGRPDLVIGQDDGPLSQLEVVVNYNTAANPVLPAADPLLDFPFDEIGGTVTTGQSVYAREGSIIGATLNNDGRYDKAYAFGSFQTVTLFDDFCPEGNEARTIAFWVHLDQLHAAGSSTLLSYGAFTGNRKFKIGIDWTADRREPFLLAGGEPFWASRSVSAGEWYFIALTHDGDNTHFFVNGERRDGASGLSTIDTLTGGTLRIGSHGEDGPSAFNGSIDEVRIYDVALSSEEIFGLYKNGFEIDIEDELALYYDYNHFDFDPAENRLLNDLSPNHTVGMPTNVAFSREGVDEFSAGFNGFDAEINLPDDDLPRDNHPRSISTWVKINETFATGRSTILRYGNLSQNRGLQLGIDWDNGQQFFIGDGDRTIRHQTRAGTPGIWYHVVYIYDGNARHRLFVNGQEQLSQNNMALLDTDVGFGAVLGGVLDAPGFVGDLDDTRV
ncbi:MAG: LamG domain-containing protein, partial [Verrucomicrobiota bacterium]